MKAKHTDEALLISVAESIGSTLGVIAAKADAAQKALGLSSVARTAKREGRKLVRKTNKLAGRSKKAAGKVGKSRVAKKARATARRVTKIAARPTPSRARRRSR